MLETNITENLTEEIWKFYKKHPIGGSKTKFNVIEVSNFGRVKDNGKIREFHVRQDRYINVGGERLHVVVAKLFIPNPENKPFIDHIDRNKHNNRVDNLRWCTPKENANNPNTIEAYKNAAKQRRIDYKDSYKNVGYKKGHESHKGRHWYIGEDGKRHY